MKIEFFNKPSEQTINIREQVFVKEQGFIDEFDEQDNKSIHLLISIDNKPVSTGRFFQSVEGDSSRWTIGRFAVMKEYRSSGIGRKTMEVIENKIIENGGKIAELSAQVQAEGFYKAIGYTSYGDIYYDQHSPHIHMEKVLSKI